MKHIRVSVRPDTERSPPFVAYLLDSPAVNEAQAIDWNRGDAAVSTHLYAVDGDAAGVAARAEATDGVEAVTLAEGGSVGYALLSLRDEAVPLFGGAAAAIDRPGLVVRRPLVYREGLISGHVVGDPAVLQATIEEMPDAADLRVEEIREFPSARVNPATALSERQAEALQAALELGYYHTPREATHEEIAEVLGCAPNTASEHLQKGEAKLVRAGVDALDSTL